MQISRQPHEALRQRIIVNCHLKGLTKDETFDYITSRLKIAACHEPIFTDNALELLFASTNGYLRLLNSFSLKTLLFALSTAFLILA